LGVHKQEVKQSQEALTQERSCNPGRGRRYAEAVVLTSSVKQWSLLGMVSGMRHRRNLKRQAIMSCCANASGYLRGGCGLTSEFTKIQCLQQKVSTLLYTLPKRSRNLWKRLALWSGPSQTNWLFTESQDHRML